MPKFTDDGVPPVVFEWPVATKGSPGAFSNVDYDTILTQIKQFFPATQPPNVSQGIIDSNTYGIGVFYKVSIAAHSMSCSLSTCLNVMNRLEEVPLSLTLGAEGLHQG